MNTTEVIVICVVGWVVSPVLAGLGFIVATADRARRERNRLRDAEPAPVVSLSDVRAAKRRVA